MPNAELTWKFAEELIIEPESCRAARTESLELGVRPISAAVGAQLALLTGATAAATILEVGTGTGVSGLWLLSGAPADAQLTSIDIEPEHHRLARAAFTAAEIPANRVRLITGRPLDVLPRMNEASYDVVLVSPDSESIADYLEHALRLVRPGGVVALHGVLRGGKVADPTQRDTQSRRWREIIERVTGDENLRVALSTAGDGLLQLARHS